MGGTFSDSSSLKAAIEAEVRSAMSDVATNGKAIGTFELLHFYSQGNPKTYIRTGAYGNSLRCNNSGLDVEFHLENPSYHSDTGKTPATIMGWIEHGGPWIQGRTGRWNDFVNVDLPPLVIDTFDAHGFKQG